MEKLYIVGFGTGDNSFRTSRANDIINASKKVLTTGRISSQISGDKHIGGLKLSEIINELENNYEAACVIVSGDCGFFSVSGAIAERFKGVYDIEIISGISSVQYLSAKLKVPYDDAVVCSMHGRSLNIAAKASYNKKLFVLTGGEYKAHNICDILDKSGMGHLHVTVGENLSYSNERIVTGSVTELKNIAFQDLAVMYIENDRHVNPHAPLSDDDFIRGGAPMTKEEVRWLSVNKLKINKTDIVYDIGAGTGSVSIELARKAFEGAVYAIEMKDEAAELISENRKKHGAYNVNIIKGKAPEAFKDLPVPDKAFIGGSDGNMNEILNELIKLNPEIKVTANAITLQSVCKILNCMNELNAETDVICVNIAKSKKAGVYDMMMGQNPVYIISGKFTAGAK